MCPPTLTWTPVLRDDDLERARGEIAELSGQLLSLEARGNPGLSRGEAGFALLWTYLGLSEHTPRALDLGRTHLERAVDSLEAQAMLPGLYAGFIGVAWVQSHIERHLYRDSEVDICEEVDDALLEILQQNPWRHDYDLIRGLVGFGVYLLERYPRGRSRHGLELVLDRLIETSCRATGGVTWHTPARLLEPRQRLEYPDGFTSLGVAHGVAGVFPVLAGMISNGIGGERARSLFDDAFEWLLAQRLPDRSPASFANFAGDFAGAQPSRLAWCYGDAGIAAALYAAAQSAGHDKMRTTANQVGLKAAVRDFRASGVMDTGLCHGSAGVAHIFNRLFHWTGDARFRDASRNWHMRTLDSKRPAGASAPYPMWDPTYEAGAGWRPEVGLLEGAGGVALAIQAATTDIEPQWDRFLLLSIPEPRPNPDSPKMQRRASGPASPPDAKW